MSRVIEVSELSKHNTGSSCWVAIDGVVYDVTEFLSSHPGGASALTNVAGTDATEAFDAVGHSSVAKKQMSEYAIGTLSGAAPTNNKGITAEEVKKHNTIKDGWIVVDRKVYDVSAFEHHPGGSDVLAAVVGGDATADFKAVDHSASAQRQMKDFFVGELMPGEVVGPADNAVKSMSTAGVASERYGGKTLNDVTMSPCPVERSTTALQALMVLFVMLLLAAVVYSS